VRDRADVRPFLITDW